MANLLLDIPERFTWATGASRIVDPVTAGYTLATGYDYSQKPPPKTENYFRNLQYRAYEAFLNQNISSFRNQSNSAHAGITMVYLVRIPTDGAWIMGTAAAANNFYSHDGTSWSAAVARTQPISASDKVAIVTDSDGLILACTTGNLEYTANGAVWNTSATARANSILANRGTDDFFLELNATGPNVYIWATGITGGSVAATTPPAALGTSPTVCGGDAQTDWYITNGTTAYVSTDSADTWASTGGSLSSVATPKQADYCDGTWIVAGDDGAGNAAIDYSTDEGVNWTAATFHSMPFNGSTYIVSIKALGEDMWVACGYSGTVGYDLRPNIIVSMDDGLNWYPAASNLDAGTNHARWIWCDGARIAITGYNGTVLMTDPISLV